MPQKAARLGKSQRLLQSSQFKSVFGRKIAVHGQFFSLHVAPNEIGFPRLGITVSRRVSKRAVQRNRIKRQIRESFRASQYELMPMDCIVISKIGSADICNANLRIELDNLWPKADQKCRRFRQNL